MAIDHAKAPAPTRPEIVDEQLFCALTGRPVSAAEAYWAPPLVTVREPAGLVVSWASIGEAEKTNRQVISTAGANILCLVNTIDLSP